MANITPTAKPPTAAQSKAAKTPRLQQDQDFSDDSAINNLSETSAKTQSRRHSSHLPFPI
jgi:hypothetical protein